MAVTVTGAGFRWFTRVTLALGTVLLLTAPVLVGWVTPLLAQSPRVPGAGMPVTSNSAGTVTTLFDLEANPSADGPPIRVTRTRTTTADEAGAEEAEAAGFNAAVTGTNDITVAEDGRVLAQAQYRVAADRHTQALIDCCGTQVDGIPVTVQGAGSPLRLPWFTPEVPYPYFDVTARTVVELQPIGRETVEGISALKFQTPESPIELGVVDGPGRLAGSEGASARLTRAYSVNRTLWVDPTTGIILREVERMRQTLRDDDGGDVITLVVMTTATTQEQVRASVARARQEGRPVLWAHSYGPAICLGLGSALVLCGGIGWMVRRRAELVAEEFPDELASFDDLRPVFD